MKSLLQSRAVLWGSAVGFIAALHFLIADWGSSADFVFGEMLSAFVIWTAFGTVVTAMVLWLAAVARRIRGRDA